MNSFGVAKGNHEQFHVTSPVRHMEEWQE